jgi:ribosomal protein L31E
MPPINYDNRYPVLYAQNISRNDSAPIDAGDDRGDLEKLEAFARQNMFPLKFELNKLPVMVREPKKKDNPSEDDPRYGRADNLGRLGPNDMAQRKKIANAGLKLFKSLRLQEKAKTNIESVKLFVEEELAKDKIKLSDIVSEEIWLANEKNIETLILNHVQLGPETGAVDKKTNQPLREAIITKRQNRYSFKSTSEARHIEFLKMLDDFFNQGVYEGEILKDTISETRILKLNQFLSKQVHRENLTVNKEGTSIKADLEMKTQNLTTRQRTLVAYYLWALAEYARVNTRQFILLTHSNYDSIDIDEKTLGDSVYLQNMRYLYNVLADCTGNTYDLILEINKQLDPDIAATMTFFDKIRDGDEYFISGAFLRAKDSYDAAADQNAKRRNKSPEDFYSVAIAVRLKNLKLATGFGAEITGRAFRKSSVLLIRYPCEKKESLHV